MLRCRSSPARARSPYRRARRRARRGSPRCRRRGGSEASWCEPVDPLRAIDLLEAERFAVVETLVPTEAEKAAWRQARGELRDHRTLERLTEVDQHVATK